MMGKCNIFVASTSALRPNDGCTWPGDRVLAIDTVIATIETLKAK